MPPPSTARRLAEALNPLSQVRELWIHRHLIGQFTRREIEGRYRGSFLGILWSLVTPLLMLGVFTFVYGMVFKARWPSAAGTGTGAGDDGLAAYAVALFAGQIAFQLFAEPVRNAPMLVVGNPNYVKRVVFPLPILVVAQVGATLYHFLISLAICVAVAWWVHGSVPLTILALPVLALPLVLMGLGVAWFVSSLGVFFRDIGPLIAIVLQVLFFATPVVYPVSALPKEYAIVLQMNPLTPAIELVRCCVINDPLPDPATFAWAMGGALLCALLGGAWFRLTCKGFADVL
jgi:lipopolysaccharide transport system permease protein